MHGYEEIGIYSQIPPLADGSLGECEYAEIEDVEYTQRQKLVGHFTENYSRNPATLTWRLQNHKKDDTECRPDECVS